MGTVFRCLDTKHVPDGFEQMQFKDTNITDYQLSQWPFDSFLNSRLKCSKVYKPDVGIKPLKHKTYNRWFWGTWKSGQPQGTGIIFSKNQTKSMFYEGEFKGQPQGQGQIVYNQGQWEYKGSLKSGRADGKGQYINRKQHYTFIGQWKNSKPFIGKLIIDQESPFTQQNSTKNANKIQINLDYSRPGSHAQIVYPDGNKYTGEINCYKFVPDGDGTLEFKNGSKYKGEFSLGEFDGSGKFLWADGSMYEGEYQKGKRYGEGRFIFESGNYYEGLWREGKQHGYGTLFNKNGQIISRGEWNKGVLQGTMKKNGSHTKSKSPI